MWRLLEERHGELDPAAMQDILRDRASGIDCLCRHADDYPEWDTMTFASIIAQPTAGRMWVSAGPPDENAYVEYGFTAARV